MASVLEFRNYSMGFADDDGAVYNLIDEISFSIAEGAALGIVGESGCGKSMTSLSVMRLLPDRAVVQGGEILFKGENLLAKTQQEMGNIRGSDISMIFQEPMTSLNPVQTIGFQMREVLDRHEKAMGRKEKKQRIIKELDRVGIPNPEGRLSQYPFEFSGGMRQRVMIGMATLCHPALLIADEPTTALDVTIQAQVLDLMRRIKAGGSLMLITHNLGVVAEICDEVAVMYAGRIVEKGTLRDIFNHPAHPYTLGLMASMPTLLTPRGQLNAIPGSVPTISDLASGCRFADRCAHCQDICREKKPVQAEIEPGHFVSCNFPQGTKVSV